jgi:hypothetical protein
VQMKRSLLGIVTLFCCVLSVTACRMEQEGEGEQVVPAANSVEADDYVLDIAGASVITLNNSSISATGEGVTVDGTTALITSAGTYTIRGTLSDGQIKVNAGATAKVKLILDGVNITTSDDAPIFIKNAAKAVLYLAPSSTNTLTDGAASTRDGAIHCKTRLSIFGPGMLNITGRVDDAIHAKGGIIIEDGVYNVKSLESGIKSKINVIINGGTYTINAGNDGMHAEDALTINGGNITVAQSVEGLEGATVTINGGNIHITSSDDGVNASSGGGNTAPGAPGGGAPGMGGAGSNPFYMRGGYVYVNANGDGFDINGPVEMSDGTIIVNGPTANDNGALDYTGSFSISGGYLLAVGSAGMAQAPSQTSTENSVMVRFSTAQQANALVHVQNAAGVDILTFKPVKRYQSVVLSSAQLARGSGYALFVGGSSTGLETDGLFSGGVYYGGTLKSSFSISGVLTTLNVN